MEVINWERSKPFVIDVTVGEEHIDGYGHVSNHFYNAWMTDCMFAHSAAVGLTEKICLEMKRGMAVRSIRAELLRSAYQSDQLKVGNWLIVNDGKLRATRLFQILNSTTGETLVRAEMDFICTNLESGRPVKMPELFVKKYCVDSVAETSDATN
jgi:acyl-CoA thioester hydrolase